MFFQLGQFFTDKPNPFILIHIIRLILYIHELMGKFTQDLGLILIANPGNA